MSYPTSSSGVRQQAQTPHFKSLHTSPQPFLHDVHSPSRDSPSDADLETINLQQQLLQQQQQQSLQHQDATSGVASLEKLSLFASSAASVMRFVPCIRVLQEHEGALWLTLWFSLNVFVTLLNKAAFQFFDFNFPITLSFVHMVSSLVGSSISLALEPISSHEPNRRDTTTLILFSVLFCSNIIVGNSSLRYVSVSLVQIIRSTIPAITIVLSMILLGKVYKREHFLSLCPIIAGVCMASLGEIEFHFYGFLLTILVCLLSSLKTVVSNMFLVGPNKLPPMEFLRTMSFYSCLQMIPFIWASGEFETMKNTWTPSWTSVFWILTSGILAFFLNHASFMTNKTTSPLAVTVAGNVKHVATIVLSVIFFDASMTPLKALGTIVTVIGGAWYSSIEYHESQMRKKVKSEPDGPRGPNAV
eukprot:TRINITY_DN443_c0_g2_i2.p1 TRINITY_DN443_c0_g2~~TRINITY_DN443_c0_g2_i2.p1  ORF type:complete len:416 (-),score=96.21 TRINITY_DN443_c0_g2_i2:604-1851(-)